MSADMEREFRRFQAQIECHMRMMEEAIRRHETAMQRAVREHEQAIERARRDFEWKFADWNPASWRRPAGRRRPDHDIEPGGVPVRPNNPKGLSGGAAANIDFSE